MNITIINGPHAGEELDVFAAVEEVQLDYIQDDEYVTATYRRVDETTFELAE